MTNNTSNLIKIFFIFGFTTPYVYLAIATDYSKAFLLFYDKVISLTEDSVLPILGLLCLATYSLRFAFWNSRKFKGIFLSLMLSLTFVPSILFICSALAFKENLAYFINLYSIGMATTAIIIPWIITITQLEELARLRESVTTPMAYTLFSFGIIGMISVATSSVLEKLSLQVLGTQLIKELVISVSALIGVIIDVPIHPTLANQVQTIDILIIGVLFIITSCLYYYFRLSKHDKEFLTSKVKPKTSLGNAGLTILIALLINFVFIHVDNLLILPIFINFSLVGGLILLSILLPTR